MGPFAPVINKALLPLDTKPILAHIIERFPAGTEFVFALGYKGQQVRDFVAMAYPELAVRFVEVDRYEGEGSGPGYSLLRCRPQLERPFYFVSCDTLFEAGLDAAPKANWVGLARVDVRESHAYCNMAVVDGRVVAIRDKEGCDETFLAFTGLMFVHDYKVFWKALANPTIIANEHQVSNGLKGLMEGPGLYGVTVAWTDVGDFTKYRAEVAKRTEYDFSKPNEFLYFVNDRVIKFFADPEIVAGRVDKARRKPAVFPVIDRSSEQFYCYFFAPGRTLYAHNSPELFRRLLAWLDSELWSPVDVAPERMRALCKNFYWEKTRKRLLAFDRKYPNYRPPKRINGVPVPPLAVLLERLPWDALYDGIPVFMHGDLHFDQTLYDEEGDRFVLVDWRQDFAGVRDFGDLYYDLAKLLGGIILNYDYIKAGLLTVERIGDDLLVDFARRFTGPVYQDILKEFVLAKGLDFERVRLLVALIYLNMTPLHHPPFDIALHALGTLMLAQQEVTTSE
jgi:hypothetical protein